MSKRRSRRYLGASELGPRGAFRRCLRRCERDASHVSRGLLAVFQTAEVSTLFIQLAFKAAWHTAVQLVVCQVEILQFGQPTQFRRYFTGPVVVPEGRFSSVSAGASHTCGLKADRTVTCWDSNAIEDHWQVAGNIGQPAPVGGKFISVSAGWYHTCGIRTYRTVACWGRDDYGQATPPRDEFISLSAGGLHSCGIRIDGTVARWGDNYYQQTDAPYGQFVSVSSGWNHSCGLRNDGAVVCWGARIVFLPNLSVG